MKGAIFRIQVRDAGSLVQDGTWAKVEASHGDKWVDLRLIQAIELIGIDA